MAVIESAHPYLNNTDDTQVYTLTTERPAGATHIAVTFDALTEVEDGYDYIYVYTGDDTLVDTFTGTAARNQTVYVLGDTVKIRLVSDEIVTAYGYGVDTVEWAYGGISFTEDTPAYLITLNQTGTHGGGSAATSASYGSSLNVPCGPFKSGDNRYLLAHDFASPTSKLNVWKSSDAGQTWAIAGGAGAPSCPLASGPGAYFDGSVIHCAYTNAAGHLAYNTFTIATDSWGSEDASSIDTYGSFTGGANKTTFIVGRGDGSMVVLYGSLAGGYLSSFTRTSAVIHTGAGWGTPFTIGATGATDTHVSAEGLLPGDSGRVHIIYTQFPFSGSPPVNPSNGTIYHVPLSSSDVLGTPEAIADNTIHFNNSSLPVGKCSATTTSGVTTLMIPYTYEDFPIDGDIDMPLNIIRAESADSLTCTEDSPTATRVHVNYSGVNCQYSVTGTSTGIIGLWETIAAYPDLDLERWMYQNTGFSGSWNADVLVRHQWHDDWFGSAAFSPVVAQLDASTVGLVFTTVNTDIDGVPNRTKVWYMELSLEAADLEGRSDGVATVTGDLEVGGVPEFGQGRNDCMLVISV